MRIGIKTWPSILPQWQGKKSRGWVGVLTIANWINVTNLGYDTDFVRAVEDTSMSQTLSENWMI